MCIESMWNIYSICVERKAPSLLSLHKLRSSAVARLFPSSVPNNHNPQFKRSKPQLQVPYPPRALLLCRASLKTSYSDSSEGDVELNNFK